MRLFWITILILVGAGLVAFFLIPSQEIATTPEVAIPTNSAPAVATVTEPTVRPVDQLSVPATASRPTTAPTPGSFTKGLDQIIKDAKVRPGRLVEKDGAINADGKFVIQGKGTKESPYEVTWELLMSASDTYIPRLGEKEIPQRIAMLNGAYVRISGYIAFPLIVTESSECLVMLNQWDGCCIGVPPSPYDAIEVKLATPEDNSKRHVVRVGTLEGVFHIDPYVVEKWLVGLYTMDNAKLSTEM
ncbi:MAG: DUF3299 domain-containing protein [Planctomycetota bacterium]|nr:DUF3299 domain-containing protein [Planctomycetota bacterium]